MAVGPPDEIGRATSGRRVLRGPSGGVFEEPALDEPLGAELPPPFRRTAAGAPAPRWVAPVFIGLAVLLIPWVIVLALTLPSHQTTAHYWLAWVGIDVFEFVALAATGWLAYRRSAWVEVSATAAATLLFVDAWYDVVTSGHGWPLINAVLEAALAELPLAGLSLWIARNAAKVNEQVQQFLIARSDRQAARLRNRNAA